MSSVIAVIDTIEGSVPSASMEVLTFADQFARAVSASRKAVVVGSEELHHEAKRIASFGFDTTALSHPDFSVPNPTLLSFALTHVLPPEPPFYVCLPHAVRFCVTAASLAARYRLPVVTAIRSFEIAKDAVRFTRSEFNGKLEAVHEVVTGSVVVTVETGAFQPPATSAQDEGCISSCRLPDIPSSVRPLALRKAASNGGVRLNEAEVIVAVGRGIGSREALAEVYDLARCFDNAAVAASRPLCDNGWLPYDHQVGVTGATVAPRLYLALGISGSSQHVAGMKGSQMIVAVNRDPQAAICSVADYIVVADLRRFLPILIEKCRKRLSSHP